MIKNLSGEFETVDYSENRSVLLYDNIESESYPMHWHNAIEIIMPVKGTYTVSAGDKTYDLNEYDIIIIPPGELHQLSAPTSGRRFIFLCDYSLFSKVSALSAIIPLFSNTIHISRKSDKELLAYVKKEIFDIYEEYCKSGELMEAIVYTKFIQLLIAVRQNMLNCQELSSLASSEKIKEYNDKFKLVVKYIDENYMNDISLDVLADLVGYSKFHFSRIFRQYNNISYLCCINQKRIKAAEILLHDPQISITDVAMLSGFLSLTTFNRIFKEIKHCTPSDYKKLYRKSNTSKM